MRWLNNTADSMKMNLSKLWEIVEDRGAWSTAVNGVAKRQTQLSNSTTYKNLHTDIYGSFIYNCQLEATKLLINR